MQLHKLVKEGVVVADELSTLQKERERHTREIEKIDTKIEELTAARRQELLDELKALGWKSTGKTGTKRQRDPNKPCPVCGETGHDARRHRGDKKKKKA